MDKEIVMNLIKIKYQLENSIQDSKRLLQRSLLAVETLDSVLQEQDTLDELQSFKRMVDQKKKGVI